MSFYKQIAVISLFLTIQILFFIPHYNNLFIILLKGVSSGGLIVLIASYAFPELIRSRKNKNNLNSKQKPFKDLQEYSFIDKRYLTLLENIKDGILSVNKNYVCGIYIFDQTSKTFNLKSSSEKIFKSDIELNNALLSSVFDKKTPKVFNHKDVKLEHWNELISNNKWRGSESAFCLPIKNNNDILGTLFVFIDHFSKINPSDIDIIQNFVEILNQGIVDIDISESQVLKNKNLNLIQDLFKEFEPGMESDIFFKSIKSACRSIFKYDKLTLSFKSSESENLSVVLTDGFDEDIDDGFSFNPRNSIIGLSFIDNKIVHSLDWKKQFPEMYRFDDAFDDSTYFPSVMSSPLRSDGKSIGSITLERMEQRLFSSTDIDLLKLLSENVSKVLGWMDIHHQLNRSASRDGLTGLLNHKTFLNRFAKEIDRSSRFGHHLGLIFFDIDKFKSVNDTYGHLYGDYVLEEVSRIINKNVRSIDIVGRYGGEDLAHFMITVWRPHEEDNLDPEEKAELEKVFGIALVKNKRFDGTKVSIQMEIKESGALMDPWQEMWTQLEMDNE